MENKHLLRTYAIVNQVKLRQKETISIMKISLNIVILLNIIMSLSIKIFQNKKTSLKIKIRLNGECYARVDIGYFYIPV